MDIHFTKYHGLGNDYLVIDPNVHDVNLTPPAIRLICDRNFGVGSDGILYGPARGSSDLSVQILNPDGSEAEKSGNGLRIFARYLFEKGYVDSRQFDIGTLGGTVRAHIHDDFGQLIRIEMGSVTFLSSEIPVSGEPRAVVDEPLEIADAVHRVTCLSIGNPHCVIPMDQISEQRATELGPLVENHPSFPNRINVQLLKVLDRRNIEIRIWERGAGYTLASGSSSCAAAAAAHKLGLVDGIVNVKMPGGTLLIEINEDWHVRMTGPTERVFEGTFNADFEQQISKAG